MGTNHKYTKLLTFVVPAQVDGIIAGTVKIQVISGQFLSDKKVGTYVEVDMFGLPADTVRKKFRTNCVRENGINPVYDEKEFEFSKVVLPELACIRLTAYEEGGRFIGHRVLPVIGLCPGYRHVTLRTEMGQPITLATLFMKITVQVSCDLHTHTRLGPPFVLHSHAHTHTPEHVHA